jgi:hypothetical protein
MDSFAWKTKNGFMVLNPEIQLLYKSRSKRPKDFQDLHNCLPVLNIKQKANLKNWIAIDSGEEHPWLKLI